MAFLESDDALDQGIQSGLRWTAIRHTVTAIAGVASVLVYSRFLTPDALGAASLAWMVYEGLYLLIRVPFGHAVVYYQNDPRGDHASAAFWLLVAFAIPAVIAMILVAPALGRFYQSEEAAGLTQAAVIAFLFVALATVPAALLVKQMRFAAHETFLTIHILIQMIGWMVLSVLGFGAWSLILPSVAASIFWLAALWITTHFRPLLWPSRQSFGDIFRFSRSLWGSELINYAFSRVDNAGVGTLGERALGFYAFGEDQATFAVISVSTMIAQVALPALAALQNALDRFREKYVEMLRLTAALTMPMQVGALVVADIVLPLMFGGQWLGAVSVFRAYMLYRLVGALLLLSDAVISSLGVPHVRLRMHLITIPFYVLGMWVSLRWWGTITAVALTLAFIRIVAAVVYLVITWRLIRLPIRDALRAILPSGLAAVLMGLAAWGVRTSVPADPLLSLALSIGVAVVTYGLAMLALDRAAVREVLGLGMQLFVPPAFQQRALRLWQRLRQKNTG